jgi:ABC-type arginine transport system permease subunit
MRSQRGPIACLKLGALPLMLRDALPQFAAGHLTLFVEYTFAVSIIGSPDG